MLKKGPLIALSAMSLLSVPVLTPAAFADTPDKVRVAIPIRGLDLSSAKGQAALKQRIELTARHLCGERLTGSFLLTPEQTACISDNRKAMTEQVKPRVIAAQQNRIGAGG